jgi:hypothetical protein
MVTKEQALAELQKRKSPQRDAASTAALALPLTEGFTFGLGNKATSALGALGGKTMGEAAELFGADMQTPSIGEIYRSNVARGQGNLAAVREQQPIASTGAEILGAIGGAVGLSGTAPIRALGSLASRGGLAGRAAAGFTAGDLAQRTYEAGQAPVGGELAKLAQGPTLGGVLGGALPLAGSALRAGARSVIPSIDEAIKPLVNRAKEFGIPLRMEQVAPTKLGKTLQKVSQSLPASGTDSFESLQRQNFTKAVAKTIGLNDVDSLSPESIKMFKAQNSNAFERALGGKTITVDRADKIGLFRTKALINETTGLNNRDAQILGREVDKVAKDFSEGTLGAKKLADIRSGLIEKAAKAGSASPIYDDLLKTIDDMAARAGDAKVLQQARREYRNFKTIEPLLTESQDGIIDPTKLLQKVRSSRYISAADKAVGEDDLIDLARIGKMLGKQGGSDTLEKTSMLGQIGVGSAGLVVDPITTLSIGGLATLGNAALQRGLLRNQSLIQNAAQPALTRLPSTAQPAIKRGAALGLLTAE